MRNSLLGAFGLAIALAVSAPAAAQMSSSTHHEDRGQQPAVHKDRYGSWNNSWGARPGAAPKFWTRKGDWYRHVRACERRYRSYNYKTDTYRIGNKKLRCRL
jgi:hypothetical protein